MKSHSLSITIPEPCAENWDNMLPEEQGRFCNSCQKVVIDFTSMSDEEFVSYFTNNTSTNVCGKIKKSQMKVDLPVNPAPKNVWYHKLSNKFLASLLVLPTLFHSVSTQAKSIVRIEQTAVEKVPLGGVIKGKVLDHLTQKPLSGIKVFLENTGRFTISDKNGHFTLYVDTFVSGTCTLSAVYDKQNTADYINGTTIWSKRGTLEELGNKEVILYRYPEKEMEEAEVVAYIVPLIDKSYYGKKEEIEYLGGMRNITTIVSTTAPPYHTKTTFWQRITSPFRTKQKD